MLHAVARWFFALGTLLGATFFLDALLGVTRVLGRRSGRAALRGTVVLPVTEDEATCTLQPVGTWDPLLCPHGHGTREEEAWGFFTPHSLLARAFHVQRTLSLLS